MVAPLSEKWIGASMCVPGCSIMRHQYRLKPSFLSENWRCISMPGVPKKVGNAGDMVWVRSTARVNVRAAAGSGVTAVAAKAAAVAPAPLKNPRRDSAARTTCSHPGTHIAGLPCNRSPQAWSHPNARARLLASATATGQNTAMLVIDDLSVRVAGRLLIDSASARVPDGARVGLVGRNGTAKSTLFRVITGEFGAEHGTVTTSARERIGRLAQEAPASSQSLID